MDQAYAGGTRVNAVAWDSSNSGARTHPVCSREANNFGLCDMSGNAWEWIWDGYQDDYYRSGPTVDPAGPTGANTRVKRGGSFGRDSHFVRTANRSENHPGIRRKNMGFRLVRTHEPAQPGGD